MTGDLVIRGGTVVDGTGLPRRRADVVIRGGRVATCRSRRSGHARRIGDDRRRRSDRRSRGRRRPHPLRPAGHLRPAGDDVDLSRCDDGARRQLRLRRGSDADRRSGLRASAVRQGGTDGTDRDGRRRVRLRDAAGVPRQPARPARDQPRLLRRPLERAALGDGRGGFRARGRRTPRSLRCRRWSAPPCAPGRPGLSSSHAPTHLDGDGRPGAVAPVEPRRAAGARRGDGRARAPGSITYLPASAVGGINEVDEDYCIELGERSGLPIIIQGLGGRNKIDAPTATWDRAKQFLDRAAANGTPVYTILIARPPDRPLTIGPENMLYLSVPSWVEMLALPHAERLVALCATPSVEPTCATRSSTTTATRPRARPRPPPLWETVFVQHVRDAANQHLVGRSLAAIGAEHRDRTGRRACSTSPSPRTCRPGSDGTGRPPSGPSAVRVAQVDPRMIIGTSDGGAHLARDDAADWSSWFLRNWVLDRQVWTLEEGIRQITHVPAAILGLSDRGTLEPGRWGDVFMFDPARIDAGRKEFVRDLPGGAGRFQAWPEGVVRHDRQRRPGDRRRDTHREASRPGRFPRLTEARSGPARSADQPLPRRRRSSTNTSSPVIVRSSSASDSITGRSPT